MKTLVQFQEELDEALTPQQRIKRKQSFRKNKAKIMRGRKIASRKKASTETLKKRAINTAKGLITKKLLKGRTKDELSFSEKEALEKKLKSKKRAIARIAKKVLPKVREKDQNKNKAKKEDVNEAANRIIKVNHKLASRRGGHEEDEASLADIISDYILKSNKRATDSEIEDYQALSMEAEELEPILKKELPSAHFNSLKKYHSLNDKEQMKIWKMLDSKYGPLHF